MRKEGSFHVSEDGVVRPCEAQTPEACTAKGLGGLGKAQHFDTEEDGWEYIDEVLTKLHGVLPTLRKKRREPILERDDRFSYNPESPLNTEVLNGTSEYLLTVDYDREVGSTHDRCEGVCRCSVITNAEITGWEYDPNSARESLVMDQLGLKNEEDLHGELMSRLSKFSDEELFEDSEILIGRRYYGDELEGVRLPEYFMKELKKYYYDQEYAPGPEGVLTYLRAKGIPTRGKRPLEALKESLIEELGDERVQVIQNAHLWVMSKRSDHSSFHIPNLEEYKKAEQTPTEPKGLYGDEGTRGDEAVAGVLAYQYDRENRKGYFSLIDGYKRHAWIMKNAPEDSSHRYIVLGTPDSGMLPRGVKWRNE